MREHGRGDLGRRGLDPRGPLPPGDRRVRGRRGLGHLAALDRVGLPGQRRGGDRRRRGGRGAALRPPAARDDHRLGRGGPGRRVGSGRAGARHPPDLRGAGRQSRPTARSTAPGSTWTTSARSWRSWSGRRKQRGIDRLAIAGQTVFVSHETYTPARGGSASAEISALRRVFGPAADSVVITNTKGFTGHAMGAGIEEVVAVKALETGIVPPVANFREIDPELGAAEPVPRRRLPGQLCPPARRRLRLADRDAAAALDRASGRPAACAHRASASATGWRTT